MGDPKDWHTQETYRGLISLGQGALRIAAVINGGAVVAFLAFMAKLFNGEIGTAINLFWAIRIPMLLFVAGLVSVGLASASAYIMQLILFNEEMGRARPAQGWLSGSQRWLNIAFGLLILSYVLFAIGATIATLYLT